MKSPMIPFLAAALAALACNTPTWQQNPTTNKPRKNVVVQFTDASLHPAVARVLAGGNVSWVNYAESYQGTVSFSKGFKDALTCHETRPLFSETGTGYESIPITGQEAEDVSLPCPLKPGTYEYELLLYDARVGDFASGMGNPLNRMPGKIVVE